LVHLPGFRLLTVWLPVPLVVAIELTPKLLVKPNLPSPPIVFLTMVIEPRLVLVMVQVVVPPATTVMLEAVPLLQMKVLSFQPVCVARHSYRGSRDSKQCGNTNAKVKHQVKLIYRHKGPHKNVRRIMLITIQA
jgi:hypothetical protein